jgi:hypothetical protein
MVSLGRKFKEAVGMVDNVAKFKKLSKLKASYVEYEKFANSNLREGYFCYNCIYWMNVDGGKCMIVEDDGPDVMGKMSKIIAPHGCCAGYEPNYSRLSDTRKEGERKKKLATDDVT